jgi:hypothetical protein
MRTLSLLCSSYLLLVALAACSNESAIVGGNVDVPSTDVSNDLTTPDVAPDLAPPPDIAPDVANDTTPDAATDTGAPDTGPPTLHQRHGLSQ